MALEVEAAFILGSPTILDSRAPSLKSGKNQKLRGQALSPWAKSV